MFNNDSEWITLWEQLGIELQWSLSKVYEVELSLTIEDQTFADDFLRLFDTSFQKYVKSHVFLKFEKYVKYVFSNTGAEYNAN